MPLSTFISFSSVDVKYKESLKKHLLVLERQQLIKIWDGDLIRIGTEWDKEIKERLKLTDIFIILLSPDSVISEYVNDIELKIAIQARKIIFPIILRPCNWLNLPISRFQCLPKNGKPISLFKNKDQIYTSFDRTIFYPQGGGQESDIGEIFIQNLKCKISITSVRFKDGQVLHYGNFIDINNVASSSIIMNVNKEVRLKNTKLHTAGHLIASIVEKMNLGLRATKGYHFSNGSYIGFQILNVLNLDYNELSENINNQMSLNIKGDNRVIKEFTSLNELEKICDYIPSYLPKDKPLRVVTIEGFYPIPCGGTHVNTLRELEFVNVTKVRIKKGELKISYTL